MGTYPTPSELRTDNNHPGQSPKEGSATEPRIPGDIDGTLGTGRVCDSRRSRVSVGDVAFSQPTDTSDTVPISHHLRRLLVSVYRTSLSRHPLRFPSRHALRRPRHQLARLPTLDAFPKGMPWVHVRVDHA